MIKCSVVDFTALKKNRNKKTIKYTQTGSIDILFLFTTTYRMIY